MPRGRGRRAGPDAERARTPRGRADGAEGRGCRGRGARTMPPWCGPRRRYAALPVVAGVLAVLFFDESVDDVDSAFAAGVLSEELDDSVLVLLRESVR